MVDVHEMSGFMKSLGIEVYEFVAFGSGPKVKSCRASDFRFFLSTTILLLWSENLFLGRNVCVYLDQHDVL